MSPLPTGGFADVEESSGFDNLPAGTYNAVIYDSEVREAGDDAKYPGNQYISWELNITEDGYEGRKLWYTTSLATTPKALENRTKVLSMLLGFLKACGYTDEELNAPDFELDPEDLYGTPVKIVVGIRKWNGEERNNVKRVMPADADASASDLP